MNLPTPGLFTTGDYKKDGYVLLGKLVRTKDIDGDEGISSVGIEESVLPNKLKKCLTTLDLTSLGVGSCVGTGMYLVSGMVARNNAGPGVIFSFLIAAVASILSGICYAEFGVRVPHTTGSAYMYSYVTVGEFIAFIIGWNMILEYLIGTSACACALSACFDSLTKGHINETIFDNIGTLFGHTPDILAFVITLLMMAVLAIGVKKSLIFNNVLNIVNFGAWVFIMIAGLFYVDFDNWTNFMPFGLRGVFTGAATCFYAFIGFDIIATTGEEANNPKKSIPLAIISSLLIVLVAYITSSMMLTLMVPYYQIAKNSALVAMFGQYNAFKCQMVVAIGALAGLTVSMFGSMFPMPRVIYAMAQDGLIFRELSAVLPLTGTPVFATVISGFCAAVAALLLNLEILVEMMSIGTLLAYTLVSTCVLILRYQPPATNLVRMLPDVLRTPVKASPIKETIANGQIIYGSELKPDDVKKALGIKPSPVSSPGPEYGQKSPQTSKRVIIRRITRSSPDSDDLYGEEEDIRDNECLVSGRNESNKSYGATQQFGGTEPSTAASYFNDIKQRLQAATYLCPIFFPWVEHGPATEDSGKAVVRYMLYLYVLIIALNVTVVYMAHPFSGYIKYIVFTMLIAVISITILISRKPQNRKALLFMTPGVPFVPVIAVLINIYLILNLSGWTLVRFTVWMIIGLFVYFYYGIKNSTLELEAEEMCESTVNLAATALTSAVTGAPSNAMQKPERPLSAISEALPARPTTLDTPKLTSTSMAAGSLFVSPSAFPKWEDE